ncbi:AT-hook motif nuclear-localized protein 14-like [Impatiens glandulifera]|uniref:AT-hook motif nuclear-localized protein 14-like n=1 Tax=Impatiens glandulifera TaxID=253017 RepID=UPI001FB0DC64|nr:AT-hook motif nuclear-localized protein 14-like [Impatiens glandulifera]
MASGSNSQMDDDKEVIYHSITLEKGQDIVETIIKFALTIPRDIMVLSATGTISYAEIQSTNNFTKTLMGSFKVIQLSASLSCKESTGNIHSKYGIIGVVLRDSYGNTFGGKVNGPLVAGDEFHLVLKSNRKNVSFGVQQVEVEDEERTHSE